MRKSFNFISMFMIVITLFSGFFAFNNQDKVDAESVTTNSFEVKDGGRIDISYKYGISEVLIFIQKCKKENEAGNGCEEWDQEKKGSWPNQYTLTYGYVYHVSGRYQYGGGNLTIHLYKSSYVNVGDYVKIWTEYKWINNSSETKLLFCNLDAGIDGCEKDRVDQPKREKSVVERIKSFDKNAGGADVVVDGVVTTQKGLVVKGSDYDTLGVVYGTSVSNNPKFYANVIKIDNTEFEEAEKSVDDTVQVIINVCLICIGLAYGVTVAVIGVKIVKSADEPQERMEALKRLRNITIGLVLAFLVVWAMPTIVKYIEKLL